jgi:hypothetical protein
MQMTLRAEQMTLLAEQMTLRADLRMDLVRQLVYWYIYDPDDGPARYILYTLSKKCEKISVIHLQCRHQPSHYLFLVLG